MHKIKTVSSLAWGERVAHELPPRPQLLTVYGFGKREPVFFKGVAARRSTALRWTATHAGVHEQH